MGPSLFDRPCCVGALFLGKGVGDLGYLCVSLGLKGLGSAQEFISKLFKFGLWGPRKRLLMGWP